MLWRSREALAATEVTTTHPTIAESSLAPAGTPVLTASGYLVARREAVVSAKIQGRLSELRVEEGSVVPQGGIIAKLESDYFEAQVGRARAQVQRADAQLLSSSAAIQRAEADLAEFQRQLRTSERLTKELVAPVDQLEAAQSRVKLGTAGLEQARADRERSLAERQQAQADLAYSEAMLNNTVIRAPFAGTVVKKMAEVGESVAPIPPGVNISTASGAIVALADLATLEMEADVAEANVAKLVQDQLAEVMVEAFQDRRYRAVLRQIIPTADRTKATVQVKVTLIEKDADLKPEMTAKVTFLERDAPAKSSDASTPERVIFVPLQTIVTRDGAAHVFEVVHDKVRARLVVTGSAQQDRVLVKQGLVGTETLVLTPPETMKDGDAVRVKS
jgi:HlyD family secretion protein